MWAAVADAAWVSTHIHMRPFIVQNRVGRWEEKGGRSQLGGLNVYFVPMPSNVTQGLAVCFLSIYFKNLTWPHDTLDLFCFQPVGRTQVYKILSEHGVVKAEMQPVHLSPRISLPKSVLRRRDLCWGPSRSSNPIEIGE